jgi:hypothetical protein
MHFWTYVSDSTTVPVLGVLVLRVVVVVVVSLPLWLVVVVVVVVLWLSRYHPP